MISLKKKKIMSIAKAYNSWANQYDTNKNKTRDLDKIATITTLSAYHFNRVLYQLQSKTRYINPFYFPFSLL